MEAIVDLSDKTTVNLNLLTHLKVNRVKKLVETGISFKEANIPQVIPNLSFMTAMLYYELAVLWENVPYAENINDNFDLGNITQMKSNELFNLIENQSAEEIDKFENKKNIFDSVDDYFRSSKDFPRAILAKIIGIISPHTLL